MRNALEELGHHQPPAPMQVNNTTAAGFIKKQNKQRRLKAIGMRDYWLQDRQQQEEFNAYWCEGMRNLADYFRKHFPPTVHQDNRPAHLHDPKIMKRIPIKSEEAKPLRHIYNACNLCMQIRTASIA